MSKNRGDVVRAPGLRTGATHQPKEIIASTVGLVQKGGTLAPAQGVLAAGTVLAKLSATKLFVPYADGGAGGAGVPVGVLRETVDTGPAGTTERKLCNVVYSGTLKQGALVGLDAGAITALNGRTVPGVAGPGATPENVFIF